MTLTSKQKEAFDLIKDGKTVFITGPGGCGKTYLIDYIKSNMEGEIVVTALTGIAATLIGGQTLHSWAGISNDKKAKEMILTKIMKTPETVNRWQTTEMLIIDEVSMMSIELLNRLNYFGQKIRENDAFFGGLQIIFSGDFCQLPPVGPTDRFCFESKIWIDNVTNVIYLDKVIRQSDPTLQKLLNEIRLGQITTDTKKILNNRLIQNTKLNDKSDIKPTILYPYNKDVEELNQLEFRKLIEDGSTPHNFISIDTFKDWRNPDRKLKRSELKELNTLVHNSCQGLRQLEVCIGAQVMLTVNLNQEKGLVNGLRGVIKDVVQVSDRKNEFGYMIIVKFQDNDEVAVSPFTWAISHPKYFISRKQFPLILAWSMSVHKSQGQSCSLVVTDLRNIFLPGQAYVALSRVKSLEGLYLQGISYSKIKCHPKVKAFYTNL